MALCQAAARFNVFNVASLGGGARLARLARLNRHREVCIGAPCPHRDGNGCRLTPELDATSRHSGHGEPGVVAAHRVPEVQS